SVPDVGGLIFGDSTNLNYPRITIDNNSSNDGHRSVRLELGEDSADDIHARVSISNGVSSHYVDIAGQNNDPSINTHHNIIINDTEIKLGAKSWLSNEYSSITIEPSGTTFFNSVHVPTPTAD